MRKILIPGLLFFMIVSLISCAGATNAERQTKHGVLIGAGTGALLGQAIGGSTEGTILGAGLGAMLGGIAGHQVGAYIDRQEQELRNAVADTEFASVRRIEDTLIATFRSDIFFEYNSSALLPGAYVEIKRVTEVLNSYPQTSITIEGHTDTRGTMEYNQRLSEKRAMAVKNMLLQYGVHPRRIRTVGFGETQPISSNHAINRRVNIVINPIEQG